MTTSTRIGVIGCGFYAANHLHSWRDLASDGAQLAAVCDTDPAKARAAGEAFGVPHFTDAGAMLDAMPLDLIDIVTRHETHRPLAEMTIARGIATIVQKPFATTYADCVAIVGAAHRAGVWLAVHENFRFQAPMRAVARVIAAGEIGPPTWARILFRTGFDVYAAQPYFRTEAQLLIADVGIHMLDLARCFLGEVERISCETQTRGTGIRAEDTATMLLRHVSGAVSQIDCTFAAVRDPDPFPQTLLEIEGPSGTIVMHPDCRMTVTTRKGTRAETVSASLRPWTAHPWHVSQEGAYAACAHFLQALRRGVPADTSGADNLSTFALVDAAYRAADSHAAVVPERWASR